MNQHHDVATFYQHDPKIRNLKAGPEVKKQIATAMFVYVEHTNGAV